MAGSRIGVVGAGTMGRGIVQLFAEAGHAVSLFDSAGDAVANAVATVAAMIDKSAQKGRFDAPRAAAMKTAIRPCDSMDALADCDVVIEAIVERMDAKQALFRQLEAVVGPKAILASNTSSLVVAELAAACDRPERVAGLHFFNPVPLMKVVEVIAAVRTAPATVATLRALVEGAGHRAVVAADQPGFLVNHAGRGLYTEGLRIVEEQVATPAEVDRLMREAAGFRMGPFELLDLTGLDVSGKVMESIYEQFYHEPRFRPSSLIAPRIAAGLFGRKSGAGWYAYDEGGRRVDPASRPMPALPTGLRVWIDPAADNRDGIVALASAAGLPVINDPSEAGLCIVQPWGTDATGHCAAHGLDAAITVAIDPLPSLARHRTLMLTAITRDAARDAAHALFTSDGVAATVIGDSAGFVVQRVLATIVNIAANIAQRGIASIADLEDAVRLGLGYPQGPLAIGDAISSARTLAILRAIQSTTGDPRYRPAAWLARRGSLGLPLTTAEAAR